jgi:uncharacterized protein YgbK (DUF1537 family)
MLLGCIADDLTGATDLAIMLTRAGMRTLQVMDVPDAAGVGLDGYDAVVVALKTRTCPVEQAVALSLGSVEALLALGAKQIFFKYCSTFDSTNEGNIGPVAEALMEKLGVDLAIACPAFPTNKRTVYMGRLFVGDVPLDESSMKDHPLTPMRDSSLVRVLQRQSKGAVGLVPFPMVNQGPEAIRTALYAARGRGERLVIVDAITDQHLIDIGTAAAEMALVTGASGVALGLPANFIRAGQMQAAEPVVMIAAPQGRAAILAGSCSQATRGQVAAAKTAGMPALEVDPLSLANGTQTERSILSWILEQPADKPCLVYSSAEPEAVAAVQDALGREAAGSLVEQTMAAVAQALVDAGLTRLIVAGGETSGAVVNRLGIKALEIGPEIDPGVPWTHAVGRDLVLALKSGNFGAPDFFMRAWEKLA